MPAPDQQTPGEVLLTWADRLESFRVMRKAAS
jgi:hypothetical protein